MAVLGWHLLSESEKAGILAGMASGGIASPPRAVQIDWTDSCNVRCFFCSQRSTRAGRELPLATLRSLFSQLADCGVRLVDVSGGGDPLAHSEIAAILSEIPGLPFRLGTVTTNGVAATPDLADRLLAATDYQISISLNCVGAESYAAAMGVRPSTYDRVIENIRNLVRTRDRNQSRKPRVVIQFLIFDDTWQDLSGMYDLAIELGVDAVAFNPLFFHNDRSLALAADSGRFLDQVESLYRRDAAGLIETVRTVFPKLNSRIDALRSEVARDRYAANDRRLLTVNTLNTFCAQPWFHLRIDPGGSVFPCCALGSADMPAMGNVYDRTILEIWMDESYRDFRQQTMQFLTDTRNDAAQAAERSRLPRACVQHGMCFLRALPYLGDTGFAVALDSLSRVHPNPHIRFPSTLVDGQACQVTGTLSDGVAKSGLQVRVNGVIAGEPTIDGSFLFFSHIADPLPTGFHLLSITTPDGRPIAARFVEKLEARDHGQMESWSAIELPP